ncbi:MAG: ornithine cyclodeaminase family protein [Oscillibacter sp.]|jgi:alanine dehydrogenase|nr:ornithine cyclodeaminase family protein [Oscillibacter sp.]
MSVLILNREQVRQIIRMEDVIREVRNVYRLKSEGQSVIWPLVNHEFLDEHAAMDIRSGYVKGVQLHGLKMLNNFPENQKKGLPSFNGIMMVYDSNTGIPLSILDATYVTSMRTGAAGALGVDLLARKDAKHLFILGAGKQAPFQIAATLLMRPAINKVYVADTFMPDNARRFVSNIRQLLADDFDMDTSGVEFAAAEDLPAAVGDSDAIITVTPSRKPVIQKAWLKRGVHLSCLGSDMESKQEIESAIFAGAGVYADDLAQCVRVGEMELPIKQGVISPADVTGEIGDLIAGKVPGRLDDSQTTIFDATGLYILDLAAAKVAIDLAQSAGIGLEVDL